ncbi:DMT family transporter [Cohnella endophytica]|uniref:DMT family transporter n=1 Tax=Cohnella endophytica TaxID=2419778 RepID=A0A494Y605_9BACL|nr:DMT family transporter [Cohnella endophytica]RKP58110.1 DMT family transporter [Cohnella endophytica]
MNNRPSLKLAYLSAVINAVIIGFSFLFTKMALDRALPLDTLMYRFAVSFALLSIPIACGWIKLNYRGKPLSKVLWLATMYPLGFFTLQAYGLKQATSAEGGILYAFTPIVTMILASVFLKEATTIMQKLSTFLSVFGVVFIFMMKGGGIDPSNLMGLFLLFLTCVAFAGYSVLARSLLKIFSPMELVYLTSGIGFLFFLVVSIINHAAAGTLDLLFAPLSSLTFDLSILYMGGMASLVTALLANYALSKIEASKISVFSNLSTIVSLTAGAMFLDEKNTVYHVVGSLLIIAGVLGTNRFGRRKAAKPVFTAECTEA